MTDIFQIEDEQPEYTALPLGDKIARSKEIISLAARMSREFYGKPMIVCYSGGKDSDVLLHLCEHTLPLSEFEVLNSHTTVDAPETVYHIRETVDRINKAGGWRVSDIRMTKTVIISLCGILYLKKVCRLHG